jgi:hypothetical protein
MFLSVPLGFRKRAERPERRPVGANCPHGSSCVFLREHGTSFRPGRGYSGDAAIPEAASRWGETFAPPRRRTVSQCLWVRLTRPRPGRRGTFTGQCGQPLCPGDATSHRVGSQRRAVVRAARGRGVSLCRKASAGLGAWPTDPAESWHLPSYPCLAPPSPSVAGRCWLRSLPGGRFEHGFPHRDGPARVGLSGLGVTRPPHRLRLSRPHLRLTPNPKRKQGIAPRKGQSLAYASGWCQLFRRRV